MRQSILRNMLLGVKMAVTEPLVSSRILTGLIPTLRATSANVHLSGAMSANV